MAVPSAFAWTVGGVANVAHAWRVRSMSTDGLGLRAQLRAYDADNHRDGRRGVLGQHVIRDVEVDRVRRGLLCNDVRLVR